MAHNKLLDVISCEMDNTTMVKRSEIDDFNTHAQLIVQESQEAIFYKDGRALDSFGPGRHSLKTDNLPIVRKFYEKVFGGRTPFQCSVFFVNKVLSLDFRWGTDAPIKLEDPVYKLLINVTAYGQMGIRIADSRKFVTKIVGKMTSYTNEDIRRTVLGSIIQSVKVNIAKAIVEEQVPILEISTKLDKIAGKIKENLVEEFDSFGLECSKFYLMNVAPLDEDMAALTKAKQDYITGVYAARTARESRDIQGFDYRTERQFNVLEEAAKNEGAGNVMAPGMGLGMGFGVGKGIANAVGETSEALSKKSSGPVCPTCGKEVPIGAAFCPFCGQKMQPAEKFCTKCGQKIPADAKFCPHCGQKVE